MKFGRKTIALLIAGAALPATMLNLGTSANASTWTPHRIVNSSGGSEPGIDIGLDADNKPLIYVHGTYGIPSHNRAWISQPGQPGYTGSPSAGQTFKPITFTNPYNRLPGGGDADIAFRGDDVWFIDLWAGSNSIQYSPDKGQTWTVGTPFTTLPLSDRQWIALGDTTVNPVTNERQTTVYATYQFIQPGLNTWIARSRDNGLTWDFHAPIQDTLGTGISGIPAHIVSDGSKTVAVALNNGGRYTVAVSNDEGETWKINRVSAKADGNGSLVGFSMNPENTDEMAISYPVATTNDDGMVNNKIVVRTSDDGGESWSAAIRMDPSPGILTSVDWFPWIDYRGDKIAVAWYQSTEYWGGRAPDDAKATNRWHVWYSESIDDGATFSAPEQVTTHPNGAKTGAICTGGLSCDADRELGDFMQVAIDTEGKTWIVMVHVNGGPVGSGITVYEQS